MESTEKLTRVVTSATTLFIVPGYAETKMIDIASRANLAVGTLYHLFKSKDDLLKFVFASTLDPTVSDQIQTFPVQPVPDDELVTHIAKKYNGWINFRWIAARHPIKDNSTTSPCDRKTYR